MRDKDNTILLEPDAIDDFDKQNELYIQSLKAEIKQLHIVIANQAEAHQKEMKEELGKQQRYLDKLAEKIEHYTSIIQVHKELSK